MSLLSSFPSAGSFNHYLNQLLRRLVSIIADLRLAIILLLAIALFSITGTVIEQDQSLAFYQQNYPENPALFGFLTWKLILVIGLNHVYTTWWFLGLLVLFGSSLTACTFKRQLPALRAANSWKFYQQPRQFNKLALGVELALGSINSLQPLLRDKGYQVFRENQALYARKGLIGRIGPIIVHGAMLIILLGAIWGSLTGFLAQEIIASGDTFQVKNVLESGVLSNFQKYQDLAVKVNNFWIEYSPEGTVDQFYSDLSIVNKEGKDLERKTIFVNEPFRYHGITFYQTNWGIAGVKIQFNNSPIFQLPMAELNLEGKGRLWGSWIPTKPDLTEGISLIAKDLQGTMFVYDSQGKLVNAIRPGMSIEVNGVNLKVLELIGATGLQIKSDPGVPIVYLGFALLMLGVIMSYVSYSQIWALQQGDRFYVGGKTNRAHVAFEKELIGIINHQQLTTNQQQPTTNN
jgi:cytochrome c biogenesis protein